MVKLTKSQWILGIGLTATLAAVAWVTNAGDDSTDPAAVAPRAENSRAAGIAAPVRKTASAEAKAAASAGVDPSRLIRAADQRRISDPFAAFSVPVKAPVQAAITVSAPPPPPPPPVEPPPPVAPRFPWAFIGRLIEDPQHPEVFLAKADRLTVAHIGDLLDGGWQVLGMDAKSLRVQYVKLQEVVSVALQAGSDASAPSGSGPGNNNALNNGRFDASSLPQPVAEAETVRTPAAGTAPAAAPASAVSGIEVSSMGSSTTP